ncbi:cupin domain-containing protein [Shewanella youngdeokensis]|uniref:Cupin domain-containing protein n=1 Tax=Shewanella youngdeokensis TaxID=2999068 RepID=A0ABZ0K2Z3_9GAMM|nr:cupin domain-containing protein [Shewanella sp. DAU334]
MLNMDMSQKVLINTQDAPWVASPSPSVFRKPLERTAAESGHTTSIVKYLAGASFKRHSHPCGEEILVLEGVFSDEEGDYPSGTYIRNPPGSSHTPFSQHGCTLLVKLNQFDERDLAVVRINTLNHGWRAGIGGLMVMPLYDFEHEHAALVKWPAGEQFQAHCHFGGEEVFVISGEFNDEHGRYPKYSWLRSPHMSQHQPFVEQETVIWVKTGHLYLAK